MSRYRVVPPYQVHHDGTTYGPGETFTPADDVTFSAEIAGGWVEQIDDPPAAKKTTGRKAR